MTGKTALSTLHDGYVLDIRKIFLATLVLGALSIVLPQAFGYNKLSVVLPLALMAAYAAIGYRRSKDSPFLEQFADSVYYLGFLFTLIALVISLYRLDHRQFQPRPDHDDFWAGGTDHDQQFPGRFT